jgi:hypothetical protein
MCPSLDALAAAMFGSACALQRCIASVEAVQGWAGSCRADSVGVSMCVSPCKLSSSRFAMPVTVPPKTVPKVSPQPKTAPTHKDQQHLLKNTAKQEERVNPHLLGHQQTHHVAPDRN